MTWLKCKLYRLGALFALFIGLTAPLIASVGIYSVSISYASAAATDEVAIPPLTQRVTDLTNTLAAEQVSALESKLQAFEQTKGSQIAVLILPTTQPDDIAQYSIRLADAWKIGRKGVGDGVILLVAKNDHKLRIEVGRGLEGAITDLYAKRIITENIAPLLKQGDLNGGLNAGVDKIISLISGEALPPPPKQPSNIGMSFDNQLALFIVGCLVVGAFLSKIFGRFLGSATTGGVVGGLTWLLAGAVGTSLLVGLLGFIFTLFIPALFSGGGRGGAYYGGGLGGGFGGSSSSGDGFSSGGGDFGGGGASGDW